MMSFIRKIKQRGKTYYAEVENVWIDGRCVQKHIRSLGTDPDHPTNFMIQPVHFSYLAVRLMQGDLTPNDVFDLLEGMGEPVSRESLDRMGIFYDFGKKTFFISLFYKGRSRKARRDVGNVGKSSMSKKQRSDM
jgi:hypothetical protein